MLLPYFILYQDKEPAVKSALSTGAGKNLCRSRPGTKVFKTFNLSQGLTVVITLELCPRDWEIALDFKTYFRFHYAATGVFRKDSEA